MKNVLISSELWGLLHLLRLQEEVSSFIDRKIEECGFDIDKAEQALLDNPYISFRLNGPYMDMICSITYKGVELKERMQVLHLKRFTSKTYIVPKGTDLNEFLKTL